MEPSSSAYLLTELRLQRHFQRAFNGCTWMEEVNSRSQMMDLRYTLPPHLILLSTIFLQREQESGLSAQYWEYAAYQVAYVKSRLHNKAIGCSPFEKLFNKKQSLHYVRMFGCGAYVYDDDLKSKIRARANPGIYLGSDDN